MADTRHVIGADALAAALVDIQPKIAKNLLKSALTVAITVVGERVKAGTPVSSGLLKAKAGIAVVTDADGTTGAAGFGFGDQQWVANLVERGHRVVGHNTNSGDKGVGTGEHVPANPFQGRGFDASIDEAIEAFWETLQDGIVI